MNDYSSGNSVLHKLNPITKLIIAFVLCAACFVTGKVYIVAGIIALNLILGLLSGTFTQTIKILLSLCKLSVILFLVQIFFIRDGAVLVSFPLNIYITDKGLEFSLLFVLRLIAAALPLAVMLSVTKETDLANSLVSCLHIPYKYAFSLATSIRFIPTFMEEMNEIKEAQTARGVEFDTKNFFKKIKLLLPLCLPLLLSSVRKIEGTTMSATLRGFSMRGENSGYKEYPFAALDYGAVIVCMVVIAGGIMV
ncbi:MAG: energy-coupling factor transporter transmembrane protein EcfT [Lachnospiraceae bacterium]|jgi:energy-coupling factor transport system permease protein|nr:energy-coupling factor transporter transmembrane protein EcfT [Lachnospiraceae bacterium]